jgi:amino-acid N-acetyltransferase
MEGATNSSPPSAASAPGGAIIRAATPADAVPVRELLRTASLPVDGIPDDLAHFLVAERAGRVMGAIGLEPYGDAALLRSAVVHPELRGTGVGERLVRTLLADARASQVRTIILLTTTAKAWFPRFGFTRITRAEVPTAIHASAEFRGACPASAVVMRLAL